MARQKAGGGSLSPIALVLAAVLVLGTRARFHAPERGVPTGSATI